jgi:putative ABC transport system permease protein
MRSVSGIALDFRLAVRWLSRRRGLAAAAIGSLALGIGANAAVFSLIDAFLFRPFPVERSEELVWVESGREGDVSAVSKPDFEDLRRIQTVFTDLAARSPFTFSVRVLDSTERLEGDLVSASFFDVLGVAPRPGRNFTSSEEEARSPVAIVSQRLWESHFAGDDGVLGKAIRVNGRDLSIVGVAPEGFRGIAVERPIDLWMPLGLVSELWPGQVEFFEPRDQPAVAVIGRVKPGMTFEAAEAALKTYAKALEQAYPDTNQGVSARLRAFSAGRLRDEEGTTRSYLTVVFGVVVLVFLIAVTNVAGLRLVELSDREGELSLRRALGATRSRIARQFFVENLVLYSAAFAASLFVAHAALRLLERLTLFRIALADLDLRLDSRVLTAAFAVAVGGALFGSLAGAVANRRLFLASSRVVSRGSRARGGFLAVQVALCLTLLVGAGLLARTLSRLYAIDPGFRTDQVLFVSVELSSLEFRYDETRARGFYADVLERVQGIPGVRSAAWSADTPLERMTLLTFFLPEEVPVTDPPDWISEDCDIVTPDYFTTMGIELLRGRAFTDADDENSPGVVVVNETMARTHWPGVDVIGKRIRAWNRRFVRHDFYEIVGVVRDAKYRTLWEEPRPYLYFPLAQRFFQRMNLHVYTGPPAMSLLPAVRDVFRAVDPDLPIFDARPVGEERAILLVRQRSVAALLGASALLALALSMVGTYGLAAHQVARRVPEVGLRMALGAERRDIVRFILRLTLVPALAGAALGLALSTQLGKALESLLIGVDPRDVATLAAGGLVALTASIAAALVPAKRASKIEPAVALRSE